MGLNFLRLGRRTVRSQLVAAVVATSAALAGWASVCAATFHTENFDGERPTLRLRYDRRFTRVLAHRRNRHESHSGLAAEQVRLATTARQTVAELTASVPPSRVFDDLHAQVWVRCNRNGAQLLLRVVFPRQKDPASGGVLSDWIPGDVYDSAGSASRWQQLTCTTRDKAVRERLRLLRARFQQTDIDTHGAYVDRVVLRIPLAPGTTEILVDNLRFGPIVDPKDPLPRSPEPPESGRIEFRLDRLSIDGVGFFPRLIPFHDERIQTLTGLHVNTVWVPRYDDTDLIHSLREAGLWSVATPPRPEADDGSVLDARQAGLVPFPPSTRPILAWNLGARVPGQRRRELLDWIEQVRNADRGFDRPLMIDVSPEPTALADHAATTEVLLGVSRHVIGTSFSLPRYRRWLDLDQQRQLVRPGAFLWTWIQTEPMTAQLAWRARRHLAPPVIEPEQIRLQAFAAVSAGYRGIGFWTTQSLDEPDPITQQRRLGIAAVALELELLEPLLATATRAGMLTPEPTSPAAPTQPAGRDRRRGDEAGQSARDRLRNRNAGTEVAMLRTDYGLLLLFVVYGEDAQCVPGTLEARDLEVVVPFVDSNARAYLLSPTGIRSVEKRRVGGGTRVHLPYVDQTAAVLLTSDQRFVAQLRRKARLLEADAARIESELAALRLARVRTVDEQLQSLGVGLSDAAAILARAGTLVAASREALTARRWPEAFDLARQAMRSLRLVERGHWERAVRTLRSPTASPHTISFQTLPEHWRMIERLGRASRDSRENLLPYADFEQTDAEAFVAAGWQHAQSDLPGIRAAAELHSAAYRGHFCLRLMALPEPGSDPPAVVPETPVAVASPPIHLSAGQLVHLSGWVNVVTPVTGSLDGVTLDETIGGMASALRWDATPGWVRFELLREVPEDGPFRLRMQLHGLGEVRFDELRLTVYTPHARHQPEVPETPAEESGGPLDFLGRLPKLKPPLRGRKP